MAAKRLCSVEGCDKPHDSHGYCGRHAQRYRKHGDPLAGGTETGALLLFANTAINSETDECILWPFTRTTRGYAMMYDVGGRHMMTSRYVCASAKGPPPSDDHEAAHTCGRGHDGCINPRHIIWATHQENCSHRAIHGTDTVGTRNAMAKITEDDVRAIRKMVPGRTRTAVAALFGLSVASVSMIVNRKRWKHIE